MPVEGWVGLGWVLLAEMVWQTGRSAPLQDRERVPRRSGGVASPSRQASAAENPANHRRTRRTIGRVEVSAVPALEQGDARSAHPEGFRRGGRGEGGGSGVHGRNWGRDRPR